MPSKRLKTGKPSVEKVTRRKQHRRKAKKQVHVSVSCHDRFCNGELLRKDLCPNCINYLDLLPKLKPQHEMGIRHYGCIGPQGDISTTSSTDDESLSDEKEETLLNHNVGVCITASAPRRQRIVVDSNADGSPVMPSDLLGEGSSSAEDSPCTTKNNNAYSVQVRLYRERLNAAVESQKAMQAELDLARAKLAEKEKLYEGAMHKLREKRCYKQKTDQLTEELKQAWLQLSNVQGRMNNFVMLYEQDDPHAAAEVLMKELVAKKVSPSSITSGFLEALMSRKRCRKTFEEFVIEQGAELPLVRSHFGAVMYEELQQKFSPWICLRELDFAAMVSFRGYEVIRRIEFAGLESAKYKRGLLKSCQELSRLSKVLEDHAETLLPYEVTSNSVKFKLDRAVPWLLEKFGLWDYVERGEVVTAAATVDGGELAWQLTQVSAGVKICDGRAINPLTGQRLFGRSGYDRVQSRYVCFPLHVHIAKDNKEFYATHLQQFFHELNAMEDQYGGLQFTHGADMCSLIKTVKRGGAMKNKRYACYCCNIHRDDLAKPNPIRCIDCEAQGIEEPCYHQEMSDEALMERLKSELADINREYDYLDKFEFKKSKIRCGNTAIRDHRSDFRHIDFDFSRASTQSCLQFRSLVANELKLRNRPVLPNIEANRIELKEYLMLEQRYKLLVDVTSEASLNDAMVKLHKAIPCLLHLENRISDAMITFLLRRGIKLLEENNVDTQDLIVAVEAIFNEKYFGLPESPSNWKFPLESDGTMGEIKLSNWRARRVIENINALIDRCIPEAEKPKWTEVFTAYKAVIKALQQKEDFSDPEIVEFQKKADTFFRKWIKLVGYDGITNYVHMLGAGHIRYYLKFWRNLNRFSNQGWEAYNQMVASFWHHRTTKGGSKYNNRSRILPIARWLLRMMMWKTGEADRFFQQLGSNRANIDNIEQPNNGDSDEESI
jgi:hypothetical protein